MQGSLPRISPWLGSFLEQFKLPAVRSSPLEQRSKSLRNALKPFGLRVSWM